MSVSSPSPNRDIHNPTIAAPGRKAAESYGFSPQADADTNVAALQAALDGGGLVTIDTPGVYDLNDTVFLDANTKLICAPGVIFRKVAPYCNVLINRGALTKEYDDNITIDGLEISTNGQEAPPTLVHGLRGHLGFFYVRHLTIRNYTCVDGLEFQFLIYIGTWEHLLIENVRLAGEKDGIKLSNGHDAVIRNLDLNTYDDGLSLCGTDFSTIVMEIGDVYNVLCSNITDHQHNDLFGRTCLIYTGSWADHKVGNKYGCSDLCVNAGNLYQVFSDTGFIAVSKQPPTHTSGTVTGDDGIPWRFVQPCDFYQTHVYNVTFENCTFEKSGNIIANWIGPNWHFEDIHAIHRTSYPGTERNTTVWGIGISQCRLVAENPQVLVNVMGNMKDVRIDGCYFNNPRSTVINVDQDSVNDELVASITGCTFVGTKCPPDSVDPFSELSSIDYQDCPILRRDIQEAGKIVVINNGGKLICNAAGNSYRGAAFNCAASNGSSLRFQSMDLPLEDLSILDPAVGDTCRTGDGLYVYAHDGWKSLSD